MKEEIITVVILPDGKSCKEVNRLGEKPEQHNDKYTSSQNPWWTYREDLRAFEEVESKLRTFEIENEITNLCGEGKYFYYRKGAARWPLYVGNQYKAVVVNDKIVRII